jgi:hypothetical protein
MALSSAYLADYTEYHAETSTSSQGFAKGAPVLRPPSAGHGGLR